MSLLSKKIKNPRSTQIIAENLKLDEFVKDDVIKDLRKKFLPEGEIVTTYIRFHIVPKQEISAETKGEKDKKIGIVIKSIDFIALEHPSPEHVKSSVVVITANKNKILEKFIK